ncbi:AMP-binding protein [Chitinimonas sp. BJB300]|uniref:AMP-binding protein n=1 Tax=Chitinimonas sp. BJB300 TaxID=1559339 RepID=UPI000C0CF459|nr:AMP-binding protein [Chitinimonas sp. BJB300]PHV13222.1 AMP-binding protein [Chitinimonas sp. BJB300]TSJ89615.1 AMP-binding protein [Chitinimonas sp. BJB300]
MTQVSYVHGAVDQPLLGQTIGDFFDGAAQRWAKQEALVVCHQQIRWCYAELHAKVQACAAHLLALGLEPGDRIGIWAPNCAEWVVMQLATAKAGLVLVNINPAYRLAELEYSLNKVACRALVLAPKLKHSDYLGMINDLVPDLTAAQPGMLQSARLPALKILIRLGDEHTPGMLNFSTLLKPASSEALLCLAEVSARIQFDDPVNIQFTSGTTGAPKGATLSHHNILNNGHFSGAILKLTPNDKVCVPVPAYHCFGMVLGNLACLTHGATIVYPDESFDAKSVLDTIVAEKCTALHGVPTMFIAILNHPDFARYDLTSLRTGIMAGSPCPIAVMKRVVSEMHMAEVSIAYGMTETSPASFQSSNDVPLERRVTTVGRIHPHVEVKIIDTEGHIVPRGRSGELCVRGYNVMLGYWGDDAKTQEAIDAAGWMHTGDLAVIDDEGYCNIVGRIKDMVIRGGENLYPREIEEFLYHHPKIHDVQIVGIPDPKYGEELCAWIIAKEGTTLTDGEVRDFCHGQIAYFKVPRYIHFVAAFPMTITGKIQKYKMREIMTEVLGLTANETA